MKDDQYLLYKHLGITPPLSPSDARDHVEEDKLIDRYPEYTRRVRARPATLADFYNSALAIKLLLKEKVTPAEIENLTKTSQKRISNYKKASKEWSKIHWEEILKCKRVTCEDLFAILACRWTESSKKKEGDRLKSDLEKEGVKKKNVPRLRSMLTEIRHIEKHGRRSDYMNMQTLRSGMTKRKLRMMKTSLSKLALSNEKLKNEKSNGLDQDQELARLAKENAIFRRTAELSRLSDGRTFSRDNLSADELYMLETVSSALQKKIEVSSELTVIHSAGFDAIESLYKAILQEKTSR